MRFCKIITVAMLFNASAVMAGGLLTNTNQSIHFLRNPARGASLEIDAVYTNPAGLARLGEGFHISINNQSAFQTRTITSTYAPFAGFGGSPTKEFKGETSAPFIPSIMAVYRTGKWALSGSFAVAGGGGAASFNTGLPSFEANMALLPSILNNVPGVSANQYSVNAFMEGSSMIFGGQLGGTYEISNMFSAHAGFRMNFVRNGYEGHLTDLKSNPDISNVPALIQVMIDATGNTALDLLKKASDDGIYLDCDQSGWGVTPILGFNFHLNNLNIGLKYEFKTGLNIENKTKKDDTGMFQDGVSTPHDIPALLAVGASYKIIPQLAVSAGYHHFFDKDAKMANDKQRSLDGGTNEILAGIEYQISRIFLISAGFQSTMPGVTDSYQQDLSFSLKSYSIGIGGAINVSENVRINVAYFWTKYSEWTKEHGKVVTGMPAAIPITDVYGRTNKVFGVGVDFSF
jgi:long-chain fatty acid transport protein